MGLWIHAAQAAALLRAGVEPEDVSWDDRLIYEKRTVGQSKLSLERQGDVKAGDSGWFLGLFGAPDAVGAEGLVSVRTFQLPQVWPAVMRMLPMPTGTILIMDGHTIERVIAPDRQTLIHGPY